MNKSIIATIVAVVCLSVSLTNNAVAADLVFLGVLGDDAAILEKSFDMRIREAISVSNDCHVQDYLTSQDFRRRISFDDFPTVSRKLVENLRQFSNDSTTFIWVTVKNHTIKPERKWLVKASAHGKLLLTLTMYSLRYKEYAFIGDVSVDFEKPEGWVFFDDLDRDFHMSATDKQEIIDQLVDSAAFKSADLISAVEKSEKNHYALSSDSSSISKYKASSISDMFNVPSVEAANVDRARKRDSRATAPVAPTPEATPQAPHSTVSAGGAKPEPQKQSGSDTTAKPDSAKGK